MDWIILEVDKFIVPVDDSLPKSKISLVKKSSIIMGISLNIK
jgi:hypothetical protein